MDVSSISFAFFAVALIKGLLGAETVRIKGSFYIVGYAEVSIYAVCNLMCFAFVGRDSAGNIGKRVPNWVTILCIHFAVHNAFSGECTGTAIWNPLETLNRQG